MSGGNQAPFITCTILTQWWSIVVATSCVGEFFSRRGLARVEGKLNAANYIDLLNENLTQNLRVSWKVTFTLKVHHNHHKHTVKAMQEWLMNVFQRPSQSSDFDPIKHLLTWGCQNLFPLNTDLMIWTLALCNYFFNPLFIFAKLLWIWLLPLS